MLSFQQEMKVSILHMGEGVLLRKSDLFAVMQKPIDLKIVHMMLLLPLLGIIYIPKLGDFGLGKKVRGIRLNMLVRGL